MIKSKKPHHIALKSTFEDKVTSIEKEENRKKKREENTDEHLDMTVPFKPSEVEIVTRNA